MSKQTLATIALLATATMLLGFGCTTGDDSTTFDTTGTATTTTSKPADDSTVSGTPDQVTPTGDRISFAATPLGNNQVKLTWETNVTSTEIDGFRFIRSTSPNPEFDRKNYWWETSSVRRETTWREIVAGTYHMRACIVRNDVCVLYSDDQVVDVR